MEGILTRQQIEALVKKQGFKFRETFNSQEEVESYINNGWNETKPDDNGTNRFFRTETRRMGKYDFFRCLFNFEVSFSDYKFEEKRVAFFESATFSVGVSFLKATFSGGANFVKATFTGGANFSFATFSGRAFFRSATFSGRAYFRSATFSGEAYFFSATFSGEADFFSATFSGEAYFFSAKFTGEVYFRSATFEKRTYWAGSTIEGTITFEGAALNQNNFFDNLNVKPSKKGEGKEVEKKTRQGRLEFKNTLLKMASFNNSCLEEIVFENVTIEQSIALAALKVKKPNRELHRIIKHEYLKQNNRIGALEARADEMKEYEKELIKDKKKWYTKDRFILLCNKYSNSYGMDWRRGVGFTLLGSGVLYVAYLLALCVTLPCPYTEVFQWQTVGKGVEFLFPFHGFDFFGASVNSGAKVIDGLSRIFIAYGFYQTIAAFRKFRGS